MLKLNVRPRAKTQHVLAISLTMVSLSLKFKLISKILIIILKTRKFSQLLRNLIVQCERNVKITLTFLV
jgi:hypothetical protein